MPRVGLAAARDPAPPEPGAAEPAVHLVELGDWEALPPDVRCHPAILAIAREPAAGPLSGVAREQGWVPRDA
jgi:hypothetical protein